MIMYCLHVTVAPGGVTERQVTAFKRAFMGGSARAVQIRSVTASAVETQCDSLSVHVCTVVRAL